MMDGLGKWEVGVQDMIFDCIASAKCNEHELVLYKTSLDKDKLDGERM